MFRLGTTPVLLILAGVFLFPRTASAKIILITRGDTIAHVGEISAAKKADVRKDLKEAAKRDVNAQVGYKYSYFGIFWLDLWTWGGEWCLYEGKDYFAIPPQVAAMLMEKTEADLSTPLWYRYPPLLLIIVGLVVLGVAVSLFTKSPQAKTKLLLEDVRYQKALEIMAEQSKREVDFLVEQDRKEKAGEAPDPLPDGPSPLQLAVDYLVKEGIPQAEAENNLAMILTNIAPDPAATPGGEPPPAV